MKINNKNSKRYALLFYGIIFLLLALYSLLSIGLLPIKINNHVPLVITGVLIIYVFLRGFHWYSLDTAGETLTLITNRYDIFSFLSSNEKKIDLPKYKLDSFELNSGLVNDDFILFFNSRKNKSGIIKVKMKISFLTKDERLKIITELNKIVETNQYQLDSKVA